jgi:Na+/H+ antiporter NhaD/arsenite permease-like protein
VNGIMDKIGLPGNEAATYLTNAVAHAFVAFAGYALFGGLKLFGSGAGNQVVEIVGVAPEDRQFAREHWITLAAITSLILGALFFGVQVGMGAFLVSVVLVLLGTADDREAIRQMPWSVIIMVSGVTVLIAVLEEAQGVDLLVSMVARISTAESVTAVVAFLTGLISVYSSTSGVVLPAFLPMVPGLAQQLGGADPLAIAASMNVGGHLVDVSPLSTIGALCIASAPVDTSRALFNKLLAWGLSMAAVGAAICYLMFGM